MSYTPTTWTTGDTITASAMNKIENGIANAGGDYGYDIVITASDINFNSGSTFTLTKGTAADVWDKITDGDYVRALLICDLSWATFPFVETMDSFFIRQTSTDGLIVCAFHDVEANTMRYIAIDSNGDVWLD